jgi:predicted nucleotidyltransferase
MGISPWRVPPYDAAIEELLAYVRATYAPIGIVVSGSIIRGEAGPTSDFDVLIVHAHGWRVREQKRFRGVPAELFVNPVGQVRRYFADEHRDGRPCTAHMWSTGEVVQSAAVITELIAEAKTWMAKPVEISESALLQKRYAIVDELDDARDVEEPVTRALLLASVVEQIIAYAFWNARRFQPRRKVAVEAFAALDPEAAVLVRAWHATRELAKVEQLAQRVLGETTFFEWVSERDPVEP